MNLVIFNTILLLAILVGECNNNSEQRFSKWRSNPIFEQAKVMGGIENKNLEEISGIVVSRNNPNLIWAHNDSGDKSILYLLDFNGKEKGSFLIKNARNRDWEDIAIGPGPEKNINYIYVADIGDNKANHDIKYIYRFKEPALDNISFPASSSIKDIETISFRYPDGNRDAETIIVDPLTLDIYIVSKNEAAVNIYLASYPQSISEVITLEHIGIIDIQQAVAGDISSDGNEILIKTYSDIYYWVRTDNEPIERALKRTPKRLPYLIESQGESIAWRVDGSGYFTISEKVGDEIPKVYYYRRVVK